jgi:hypothetical protein
LEEIWDGFSIVGQMIKKHLVDLRKMFVWFLVSTQAVLKSNIQGKVSLGKNNYNILQ